MSQNIILNDFKEDGLYIDISTSTYPNRFIMIDRDMFNSIEGRITSNGPNNVIIINGSNKITLGRYILQMSDTDTRRVFHNDGMHIDYRRSNLTTDRRSTPKLITSSNILSPLRERRLKLIDSIKSNVKYQSYKLTDNKARARMDDMLLLHLEETDETLEMINVRKQMEYICLNPYDNKPNYWVTVSEYADTLQRKYGDYIGTWRMRGSRLENIPLKDRGNLI